MADFSRSRSPKVWSVYLLCMFYWSVSQYFSHLWVKENYGIFPHEKDREQKTTFASIAMQKLKAIFSLPRKVKYPRLPVFCWIQNFQRNCAFLVCRCFFFFVFFFAVDFRCEQNVISAATWPWYFIYHYHDYATVCIAHPGDRTTIKEMITSFLEHYLKKMAEYNQFIIRELMAR